MWITHHLPLSGLTCLLTPIAASLVVPDSFNFSSDCSDRVPNISETEKGLKPPLILSSWESFFSLLGYFLTNPNGEGVWNWITNHVSKFHENPTVYETGIIVLLRLFWVFAGKEKVTVRRIFLLAPTCFCNSQRWECPELGF